MNLISKNIKLSLFVGLFSIMSLFFGFLGNDADAISIYPADIRDLTALDTTSSAVTLTWTAPGDDEFVGKVDHYDMRMSTVGSDDFVAALWNGLDVVSSLPSPSNPGLTDSVVVSGLTPATTYYFAVKGVDADGNTSQVFNIETVTTLNSGGSLDAVSNLKFLPAFDVGSTISKLFSFTIFSLGTSNSVYTFSATADSSGAVSLPASSNVAVGSYDIGVKSSKYIAKKITGVSLVSDSNVSLSQMNAGDVNSDGIINSLDWSLLSSNWFTSNASYDLNGDGFINSLDWSIVSKNWFLTGDF